MFGLFYVPYWTVLRVILIPGYLRYLWRRFWWEYNVSSLRFGWRSYRQSMNSFLQKWTLSSRRLGWRSLRAFPDSETPILSGAECPHVCQTTSKLCQECLQIVEQSRLLSGSFYILTRCTEWYKWGIPLRGSEFTASRRSCQLCNILWNSLDEQTRRRLAPATPRRDWLWVSIWENEKGRCYISLFDDDASRPENRHNRCCALEVKEGEAKPPRPSFLKC